MPLTSKKIKTLIVEDNLGDFILIEDYLKQEFVEVSIEHAKSFKAAKEITADQQFDVILLDLTLPDASGEELILEVQLHAGDAAIIVLTGYSNKNFGVKTLSLGVSDYLLKDELVPSQLYKSIVYSIERKRVNDELKSSEEKYRTLFHSSPIPMWVFNPEDYSFLDVNQAACKHYGYSREEFLSMTIKKIRPTHDLEKLEKTTLRNKGTNNYFEGMFDHYKKNGELIHVNIQSNTISFAGNAARLVVATDLTEKIKTQREREQLIAELLQHNKDLRQFSYITSHNIRGPIAQLLGLTNLLEHYKVEDPTLSKILTGIQQVAGNFDETIKDLSGILNIKDRPSILREEINLDILCNKVHMQCKSSLDESNAAVHIDFSKAAHINFNIEYLESILLNLFTNAIKYRSKTTPLQIYINTEAVENKIILKFRDNGMGVDVDYHKEKLFGLYQRFHENIEGKGIGLFLIKTQMEALRGSVHMESKVNAGTLFTLQFERCAG